MRLPLPHAVLCLALAIFAVAEARAESQPNLTRRWRATDLEKNKPDETYKPRAVYQDSTEGSDRASLPEHRKFTTQSDAFTTAAEHAVYAQAYQMFYGPYGIGTPGNANKNRSNAIKATSIAIEECTRGDCSPEKQELVMQALVQYNYGQELKRISLKNQTNAQNMKSLVDPGDEERKWAKPLEVVRNGSSLAGGERRDSAISLASGTGREKYFQLDVEETRKSRLGPAEMEALGPAFLKDYRDFVKKFSRADQDPNYKARYYKYVPAGDGAYVYDENSRGEVGDQSRLNIIVGEQGNKNIQKIVDRHLDGVKPIVAIPSTDPKKPGFGISGDTGEKIGLGVLPQVTVAKEGGLPGETEEVFEYKRFPVVAQQMNKIFQDTAEKKAKENAAAQNRGLAQSGASSYAGSGASNIKDNETLIVSLDPNRFDAFLNEIWPTSVERQKIISANTAVPAAPNASSSAGGDPQP